MNKGLKSRNKILQVAFRLFATNPYEKVSFSLLEKQTGISRGSMVYYFKNKEGLFKEVVETYVFNSSSVKAVPNGYKLSLSSFYNYFIEILRRQKTLLSQVGIENPNEALLQIEISALSNLPNFRENAKAWHDDEMQIWKDVIINAISTHELSSDIDSECVSSLFEHTYLGGSFLGVFYISGFEIDKLQASYNQLYELVKMRR